MSSSRGTVARARRCSRDEWTPARLLKALRSGTREQDLAILKRIGLLTEEGKMNPAAQSWGSKPSRTPTLEEMTVQSASTPAWGSGPRRAKIYSKLAVKGFLAGRAR
jgi:hypothetical protein